VAGCSSSVLGVVDLAFDCCGLDSVLLVALVVVLVWDVLAVASCLLSAFSGKLS